MKTFLLICSTCVFATAVAQRPPQQTLSAAVMQSVDVDVSVDCEHAQFGTWCLASREPVAIFYTNPIGLHNAIEEWTRVSVLLMNKFGEPQGIKREAYWPDWVAGIDDYQGLTNAMLKGAAWVVMVDDFTTPYGDVRLVLDLDDQGFMLMLIQPEP